MWYLGIIVYVQHAMRIGEEKYSKLGHYIVKFILSNSTIMSIRGRLLYIFGQTISSDSNYFVPTIGFYYVAWSVWILGKQRREESNYYKITTITLFVFNYFFLIIKNKQRVFE